MKSRPAADRLYNKVFGDMFGSVEVNRFEHDDDFILDQEYGIDVIFKLPNGQVLTGQEKFLSPEQARFASMTVEYEQNQHTGEKGDWYKLACQIYFCGYINHDHTKFHPWVIVNWPKIVLLTQGDKINWNYQVNKNGRARASFYWTKIAQLPDEAVIAKRI